MQPVVNARNLVTRYGSFTAVDGLSFEVQSGECFGLLGPNGAGKTTTIRMVCATSPVTSGELAVDGKDARSSGRQVRQVIGVVPQEDDLDTDLTVLWNLIIHARFFGFSNAEARRLAEETLERVQLADRQNSEIDSLSGGMKRRLAIGRALLTRPRLVLVDEISEGLQPAMVARLQQVLTEERRARGLTVVLVEQNVGFALALADRYAVLKVGTVVETGRTADVGARERIERHLVL